MTTPPPRQQINLLQDELQERKPVLPAQQLMLAAAAAVLLMTVLSVWMTQRVHAPRAELARIEAEIGSRNATITQLATLLEGRKPDPALAVEARRLERELQHLRRVAEIAMAPAAAAPLTAYMEGLGRQRPEGLWLTRITVANGGRDLALAGSALEPGLLPVYLEALGREPAFAGLTFGDLSMARSTEGQPRLDFRIAAGCLAAANGKACVDIEELRP